MGFLCEICGHSFRYKGDRTKHMRNIHRVSKSSNDDQSQVAKNLPGLTKARLQQQSVTNFPPPSEDTTSSTTSSDFQSLSGSITSTDNIFQVGALQGAGGPGSTSTATEASSAMSEDGTNASLR